MPDRRLIVLSLDGLATSALGCYGSSWNSTPAIDSLAAAGATWDRWTAASDDPLRLLGGWLGGGGDWISPWRSGGAVELLTDDRRLIDHELGERFDGAWLVEPDAEGEAAVIADDPAETHFGRLVAAAIDRGAETKQPWSVLWLHSGFLTRCWDAPRELFPVDPMETEMDEAPSEEVELLAEPWQDSGDDEPEAPPPLFDSVAPPHFQLAESRHPDLVTSWMRTYGCQIRLVDLLLDVLRESLAPLDPVVAVTSTGGFNLGQNGWIGARCGPLRSSEVRLPLIVGAGPPVRSPRLTATDRLPEILAALRDVNRPLVSADRWSENDGEFEPAVTTAARGNRPAVTTARWFYVQDNELDEHLFLKPDDADDVNDVHRLSPDAVDQLERRVASG